MRKPRPAAIHMSVPALLVAALGTSTDNWAFVVVPTAVALYVLVLYRGCAIRTEIVFICLGLANHAIISKLAAWLFQHFRPGSAQRRGLAESAGLLHALFGLSAP